MFNQLRLELEKEFKCKFKIIERDGFIELICNDKTIEDNEELLDLILGIASKYLNEEQRFNLAIVYDYLNEIPSMSMEVDKIVETTILNEFNIEFNKINYSYRTTNEKSYLQYNTVQFDINNCNTFKKIKNIKERVTNFILGEENQVTYDLKNQTSYQLNTSYAL
ncbi:hypothetical protein [Clostridium thermobutyricum]|uniref:hypothetical protein n=1 Tax=Clostridium thermobutyricum TaxID=29372 RepID=UPI0018A9F1C1|nr:hypothetical protein [Clostridium thermobutyricum]